MLKKSTCWAVLIYGLVLVGLGSLGYYLTESLISLYAGVASGGLLIVCSSLMFANYKTGSYLALAIALALTAMFSIRYSMTGKGFPATMAVISAGMLLFLLAQMAHWRR